MWDKSEWMLVDRIGTIQCNVAKGGVGTLTLNFVDLVDGRRGAGYWPPPDHNPVGMS